MSLALSLCREVCYLLWKMFYNNTKNPNFRICLIVFKLHFLCVEAVQRALGPVCELGLVPRCACRRRVPGPSLDVASCWGKPLGEELVKTSRPLLPSSNFTCSATFSSGCWTHRCFLGDSGWPLRAPCTVLCNVWCFSEVLTVVEIGSLSLRN